MKVTLINYTPYAAQTLVFTKGVRLGATEKRWSEVCEMSDEELQKELEYMANTIPSSWEFVDYVFCIEGVSRAFTHQSVRTRTGSYAQESLRVVAKEDDLIDSFVMPSRFDEDQRGIVQLQLLHTEEAIEQLRDSGAAIEDIRSILPTNISTNIVEKFNLRTLSELAKSRTGGRTQAEYISVVNAMLDEVLYVHPWASAFLFKKDRNYFAEIEAFAEREYGGDLVKKGELLKIVDAMRKDG